MLNDHGAVVTQGGGERAHPARPRLPVPRARAHGGRPPLAVARRAARAGLHNSLFRIRLKPTLMVGGYGQFSYAFNYWGPTGNNRDAFVRVRRLVGAPRW